MIKGKRRFNIGYWLALAGLAGCVASGIIMSFMVIQAAIVGGVIINDFNHFKELWYEAALIPATTLMGLWGIYYFIIRR